MEPRQHIVAYGSELARVAAERSEDPHVKVGAVILRADNSIASVGYNGTAPGVTLPEELWADRDARRPFMIHAEVNAFRYATRTDTNGGLLFVTGVPCTSCVTVAASHGIAGIVFSSELENYPTEDTSRVAGVCNIVLVHAIRQEQS